MLVSVGALYAVLPLGFAQENMSSQAPKPSEHYYRLNLTVEQMNDAGKVTNTRSFVASVTTNGNWTQSIRTGERVPVPTSADPSSQWQYMDIGVNFDVRDVKEVGSELAFRLASDISSLSSETSDATAPMRNRVVRQNKWDSGVLVPIGKPTVVFSADDLQDKGKMQVELTATRVE